MINRYRVKICGITDEVNYSELKKYFANPKRLADKFKYGTNEN